MDKRNFANKRSALEPPATWPTDPELDGPYGYNCLIVQRGGFRLGCDAPFIPVEDPKDMYRALARAQKELIARQPRTLPEAFTVHKPPAGAVGALKKILGPEKQARTSWLDRILRRREF